ncbi:MAG: hypothetical protein H7Z14_21375 [Anaerolineae bacterium]|nr:hypothetical protein [Phycisphaerae bacterium]
MANPIRRLLMAGLLQSSRPIGRMMLGRRNRRTTALMKRSWNRFRAATRLVIQDVTPDEAF